jgi:hypothetical protein
VVLVAEAHGQRVLLTGDVEAVGERALLRRLGPPGPPGQAPEALAAGGGIQNDALPKFFEIGHPAQPNQKEPAQVTKETKAR